MSGRRFIPSGIPKGVHLGATVDADGKWFNNERDIPESNRHDCSRHVPDERESVRLTSFAQQVSAWQAEVNAEFDIATADDPDYAPEVYVEGERRYL